MSAEFQKTKPSRLAFLAIFFAVMAAVLVARLFYWQVLRRDDVLLNTPGIEPGLGAAAWRGSIFDAHGHYLAVPSLIYDVGATPRSITDTQEVAGRLAPILGIPQDQLLEKLKQNDLSYVSLAKGVSADKGQAIKALNFFGIKLDANPGRYYPEGSGAATVLGFVNSEQRGYYGVEEYYDSRLRGSLTGNAAGSPVLLGLPIVRAPRNGADLVLTIDRVVQLDAQRRLEKALKDYQAESGCIIVMNPRTGAVLAIASAPTYDPNALSQVSSDANFVDQAVSVPYEPGSVFKMVTLSSALDAGAIRPEDTYVDTGKVEVGGRIFENWDHRAYGVTDMTGILAHSLNLGAIEVARRLGTDRFYEAVQRFGFGETTGIDLAGEVPGEVRMPGSPNWYPADFAANSFGQGLAVTPIQMITAVAALANDGKMMRPYVVDHMVADGQVIWQAQPQMVRQVVSPETAHEFTDMLIKAMPVETSLAVVPGYTSAGKTGTAQIFINGRYDDTAVIASFAGYLPAKDPRLAILVKLDRPKLQAWGSRCAAPVWRDLALDLCAYLGIPPDNAQIEGR